MLSGKIKLIVITLIVAGLLLVAGAVRKAYEGSPPQEAPQAATSTPSTFTLGQGDYDFSLVHDGLIRTYKVHVPPQYDKKIPTPVVLSFHGGFGDADSDMRQNKLPEMSDKVGFIAVFPEALIGKKSPIGLNYRHWNVGPRAEKDKEPNTNDVEFVRKIIIKLGKDFFIDNKKIFATGISDGGMMVYRLACELADKIAAVAPVAADQMLQKCNPSYPVSLIHFHGLLDKFVPYTGGVGKELPDSFEPIEKLISEWAVKDSCNSSPSIVYQKGDTTCRAYQNCADEAEVVLCKSTAGGHTWPGGTYDGYQSCLKKPNGQLCALVKKSVGPITQDISANEVMWEFFKKHSMK